MHAHHTDPHLFVIFGATGDLTQRKLVPALYDLHQEIDLSGNQIILGVSRSDLTDDEFRDAMREALAEYGAENTNLDAWCDERLYYQCLGSEAEDFEALRDRIHALESELGLAGNRAFYLALPPQAYAPTIESLGEHGLSTSQGWTRLVVEKPFGRDLDSARDLNQLAHRYFDESQIYRIDHYLGKETVQNLLAFRFANALFETAWHRDRVDRIEITVAEDLGVGSRAGYYDKSGALRDMVQNHLTQLFTLIAMEVPSAFTARAIRREKIKVLESVRPIKLSDVRFGQYTAGTVNGEHVPGYLSEEGVADDSNTETFVELKLNVVNWRWEGVPFILRTGKRLPEKRTQIVVHFKCAPVSIFAPYTASCAVSPNVLVITLQPDEGFELRFQIKKPGQPLQLQTQSFAFDYDNVFGALPDAYHTLIRDVIQGDQTLFVHSDEVEASWALYTPLLRAGILVEPYPAGTGGTCNWDMGQAIEDARDEVSTSVAGDGQAGERPTMRDDYEATVRVFPDLENLSRAAAQDILQLADEAIRERGQFTMALAGGSTPKRLYELLATPFCHQMMWPNVHVFWGDERYVPHDHPDSNYQLAHDTFLSRVSIPEGHIHDVPTDLDTPEMAARTYDEMMKLFFRADDGPALDLVLLGMGDDGHTLSVFPKDLDAATEDSDRWVQAVQAPQGTEPQDRITLTLSAASQARHVYFLVAGERKREPLRAILDDAPERQTLPAAHIHAQERLVWYVDRAAYGSDADEPGADDASVERTRETETG